MKRYNNRGFTAVEGMLIFLVVAVIGGVGYFVWNRQSQNKKPDNITNFEQCAAAGNPVMESYPEQCSANGKTFTKQLGPEEKKKVNPDTVDWTTFDGDSFKLSYPKGWKQTKPDASNENYEFVSPDFKPATELGPSVKAGYSFEVFVRLASEDPTYKSYDEHLAYLKKTENVCSGTYYTSKIDNQPAIITTIKCHGTHIDAYVYKGKYQFMFRLNSLDEGKSENKKLFENLLSTVVLD